jgi:hypothetical protein
MSRNFEVFLLKALYFESFKNFSKNPSNILQCFTIFPSIHLCFRGAQLQSVFVFHSNLFFPMNFKELTEPECGGANPLMRLGQQLTNDFTLRDEGASNFRDPNFQPAESVRESFVDL